MDFKIKTHCTSIYTIAEIGQAHEGSLGMLYAYIDAVAKTGVDAIKFQTHMAHAESSEFEPFRVKFSKQDQTRYEYWERMSFTQEQWNEIGEYTKAKGLDFISSPFSNAAVDLLEEAKVDVYKIGSGEVTNLLLLEKIAQTQKPVIISSGMSSYQELDDAVQFLLERKADVSILQCTTAYPTQPEQYGLNVITELQKRYPNLKIGFSDHSGTIATGIAASTLGAEILEFHVVFHKDMFGPDVEASLTLEETSTLVEATKKIYTALKNPMDKANHQEFSSLKAIFEKSLAVNKDLPKGHVVCFEDLEAKKPKGYGIDASSYQALIGKKLVKDMKAWAFLTDDDIKN
ncbi:N-acetylneuraminate synthase family protein [Psychroflexus sp. ALD_RP9]|uniref:N-acetylneuraminate synthase family protein n=1 Tax=Psychroflexus sp. ALD_RP9 TaxID=2777186 RepID=UPI001A8EF3C0|nr:N-acetylneuraminate synthase family protein [Psychroflexus sp. ALD_RP9]QSS96413.1 N-acetylneuraminate synthase family protein [Psychroflexus sp. ALD_RP9]